MDFDASYKKTTREVKACPPCPTPPKHDCACDDDIPLIAKIGIVTVFFVICAFALVGCVALVAK